MFTHPEESAGPGGRGPGPEGHRHGPGTGRRGPGSDRHGPGSEHREPGAERRGPRGARGGRGFGRPGGWQQADLPSADDAAAWFAGRLPEGWFTGSPAITVDREEIIVIGTLTAPEVPADADAAATEAAALGRISRFREETRDERIRVAAEAEARYGRKVAWGAEIGETSALFSHLSVPVMTRLRQPERRVLDTLVDAGVARSRSEALAWTVRLVGEHTEDWLAGLRSAMSEVDKLRTEGPQL